MGLARLCMRLARLCMRLAGLCRRLRQGAAVAGSSEERMMQLLRLINGLLEKHPESRSRKLAAHAPIIVAVYSQVTYDMYHIIFYYNLC